MADCRNWIYFCGQVDIGFWDTQWCSGATRSRSSLLRWIRCESPVEQIIFDLVESDHTVSTYSIFDHSGSKRFSQVYRECRSFTYLLIRWPFQLSTSVLMMGLMYGFDENELFVFDFWLCRRWFYHVCDRTGCMLTYQQRSFVSRSRCLLNLCLFINTNKIWSILPYQQNVFIPTSTWCYTASSFLVGRLNLLRIQFLQHFASDMLPAIPASSTAPLTLYSQMRQPLFDNTSGWIYSPSHHIDMEKWLDERA